MEVRRLTDLSVVSGLVNGIIGTWTKNSNIVGQCLFFYTKLLSESFFLFSLKHSQGRRGDTRSLLYLLPDVKHVPFLTGYAFT